MGRKKEPSLNPSGRDSFILFNKHLDAIKEFTNEENGELFKALLVYSVNGSEPPPFADRAVKIAYNSIIREIQENWRRYDETCKTASQNINKRWEKKGKERGSEGGVT